MPRIAFLLLCHKRPDLVAEQARILSARGDGVVIHADLNAGPKFAAELAKAIEGLPDVVLSRSIKCGWGTWSLVEATLILIRTAHAEFPDASHFFLLSGDCMPVKSARYIQDKLSANDRDYVQHADFFEDGWIKTGLTEERLIYRHPFNERTQKRLFYWSLALQRRFGLKRKLPKGIKMKIGSQWWVLRRATIDKILDFVKRRPDVVRFFKTTWIPDETFFQTLTMHLVPREDVDNNSPTFLMFSDYGMPLSFYSDHFEMLRGQWQFAARKISTHDDALRVRLGALFLSEDAQEPQATSQSAGQSVYEYVRQRGRVGTRYAPRIWESAARLGIDYELTLIICKKWHIGNRIAHAFSQISKRPAFGFVFDEEQPALPDLGGLEVGREKRSRHRRAFLHTLARHLDTKRLTICLDPANIDAVQDFVDDGSTVRILDVRCDMDEAWIEGHAERIGLGTRTSNGGMHAGVLRALDLQIQEEQARLAALRLPGYRTISQGSSPGEMARPIATALNLSIDDAARIARMEDLFD